MACASGAASIALGADLIRAGVTPTALVGGVDALTRICFMGFNALKLLDPDAVPALRPRSARHVHRRGAPRSSCSRTPSTAGRGAGASTRELGGYGMTTDAHHVTAPHPEGEGMIRAMQQALDARRARRRATVGYVNAHGTGTPQNDRIEALALRARLRRGRRAGQLDQVAGRPHDGGGGQRRGGRHDPGAPARAAAADREPRAGRIPRSPSTACRSPRAPPR